LAQACEHSPAQLKLLARAASRIAAEGGLLGLHITQAGMAAAWSREGRRGFDRLLKILTDQSRNG